MAHEITPQQYVVISEKSVAGQFTLDSETAAQRPRNERVKDCSWVQAVIELDVKHLWQ
jgi:hypothetical protein